MGFLVRGKKFSNWKHIFFQLGAFFAQLDLSTSLHINLYLYT